MGETLPNLAFVLVPFLEKHKLTGAGDGRNRGKARAGTTPGVTFDPPAATRRRLELLREVLPPPQGRALFSEDLPKQH